MNGFKWIVIDGNNIRKESIKLVLSQIVKLTEKEAVVAIVNVRGIN